MDVLGRVAELRFRDVHFDLRQLGGGEDEPCVPDGGLGVSSNEQRNIEGYADRKAAETQEETP